MATDPRPELSFLHALPRYTDAGADAYRPGLERMEALMDAMGRPHEAFPSIHVGGTNGKGSTASFVAAVGTAAGRRVGLHTSPHLYHVGERLRVGGEPASEEWLAAAIARYRGLMDEVKPSFFEATVALSFLYFAEQEVDAAVVEVGLGGRLDATNVLRPALALITNVGLEHTELLGDTVAQVAREKAGIVKAGVPLLTTAADPEAVAVLRAAAAEREAPFHDVLEETELLEARATVRDLRLSLRTPVRSYHDLRVGLPGAHQIPNARLAIRASEMAFDAVFEMERADPDAIRLGLRDVRRLAGLRGRMDVVRERPLVVADVGHNADGLAASLAFVGAHRSPGGQLFVLFNAMRDKDLPRMARLLSGARAIVWPVPVDSGRAFTTEELSTALAGYDVTLGEPSRVPDGLAHFLQVAAPEDALLITGSHLVVAQLSSADPRPNRAV